MQPHDRENGDEGFSLVEVLVAMLLFAVLLLGLIPVIVQALALTSSSASVTTASRIASSQVEAARTLQLAIGDTSPCVRFQDAVAAELAKLPADAPALVTSASDGRSSTPLTIQHTSTCDAGDDRAVNFRVKVTQQSRLLVDISTEFWLDG